MTKLQAMLNVELSWNHLQGILQERKSSALCENLRDPGLPLAFRKENKYLHIIR